MNRREQRDALVLDELGHVSGELALIGDRLSKILAGSPRVPTDAVQAEIRALEKRVQDLCWAARFDKAYT